MKNSYKITSLFLILSSFSSCITAQQEEIDKGLKAIFQESLLQTTGYLSSTKFMGRLQGSAEYDEAARYVALRLKECGLEPVNGKSMFHYFNDETNIIQKAKLELMNSEGLAVQSFKLGEDFVCRGFTGSGNVNAEVVFCGYGVSSNDYDDYKNVDVKGKIVMVFKAAPPWKNAVGNWGDTSPRGKARLAQKYGALAILLINQPNDLPERALIGSVACGDKPHLADFPMLQIGNNVVELFLHISGNSISNLYSTIISSKSPSSFDLKTIINLIVDAKYQAEAPTANIVAKIEGSDSMLKDEYIVLGAHLDHVGYQTDELIFPGANDNASGVASLVEIANALKLSGIHLKRSLLFVVFSSEESGLRGSKYFVAHSPIPVEKMVAMLNFDCVGQGDSIAIGGKLSYPNLWNLAKEKNSKDINLLSKNTFGGGGADAEAFYKVGVPTLYFNTSGGYRYLHLPTDKTETLNPVLHEKLTKLGLLTIVELANGSYNGEKNALKKD